MYNGLTIFVPVSEKYSFPFPVPSESYPFSSKLVGWPAPIQNYLFILLGYILINLVLCFIWSLLIFIIFILNFSCSKLYSYLNFLFYFLILDLFFILNFNYSRIGFLY